MSQKLDSKYFENIICINSLQNSSYLTKIADIYEPSYFEDRGVRMIMDHAFDFHERHNKPPTLAEVRTLITDSDKIKLFGETLATFKSIGMSTAFDPEELITNTEKFFKEKAVCKAILESTDQISDNKIDSHDILERFEKACNISLVDDNGFDFFKQIDDHIDYLKNPVKHLSTGWSWLDKMLGGGWLTEGRAIYVFTGWTNVGKSVFLGNVALNLLKQGKNVLVITLEMSEQIYAQRLSAQVTQIPISDLVNQTEQLKQSVMAFQDKHTGAKAIIKEFPTKTMSVEHMNAYIHKLIKKGFKPDAIVLDYINLVKASKSYKGNGTYDEIKQISEKLRASTYEFKIPLITATQLNRSGAGKSNPGMQSISESVGLSYTADVQMAIWRDESDGPTGFIHLGMQKNRYGPAYGYAVFKLDTNTLTLTQMDKKFDDDNIKVPTMGTGAAPEEIKKEEVDQDVESWLTATAEPAPPVELIEE